MNRRILEDEEQPAKIPGWALTYIDLLWLLLLFFILRSAVSDISESRHYREVTAALKKRFGLETAANAGEKNIKSDTGAIIKDRASYSEVLSDSLNDAATMRKRSLTSRGVIYFSDKDGKLQSEQKQVLQAVAGRIGPASGVIEIHGDAAEKAVNTVKTNHSAADSAYACCTATRDYLIQLGIDPGRLRIAVGGEKRTPGDRTEVRIYSVTEIVAEKPGKKPVAR
jgi:hypothetical protein